MPIVSNTSPILNLAIINRLDILRRQFGEIIIPPAVLAELKLDSELPGVTQVQQALDQGWLTVTALQNTQLSQILARELDGGEAEAIALALETSSGAILMDEQEGREAAKTLGLAPIGILGVILREKKQNQTLSASQIMDDLRRKAGFFIAEELYRQVIHLTGE